MMTLRASTGARWVGVLCGAAALVLLAGGCPTSSEGIDLSEVGELTLVVSRVSDATLATATGQVVKASSPLSISQTEIILADDQVLSVNDTALTPTAWTEAGLDSVVTATVEAVDAPATYEIAFDNAGVTTSFKATPPEDFDDIEPDNGDEVSTEGFDLAWEASDDDDVAISVTISGLTLAYDDNGILQVVTHSISLTDLADDGDLTIGSTELLPFLEGEIEVTLTRVKTISQKLGFSAGTIVLEISQTLELMLVEPESE